MTETIGVVGLGLLGRGIAACLLGHGFRVVIFDKSGCAQALPYIHAAVAEMNEHGITGTGELIQAQSFADFAPCSFVVESVFEDLAVKSAVFDALEDVVATNVVIASNTSALPISSFQASRKHPERFIGMHWAEPAYATRFLELIRGDATSDDAMQTAAALGQRLGKEPCFVQKDIPGFVVNRLGYAMYREALHLVETGVADIETVDRAWRNAAGLWASMCGPFRWIDITGGAALYAKAMKGVLPTLNAASEVPALITNTNQFYNYAEGELEAWGAKLHKQAWVIRHLQDSTNKLDE